MKPEDMRRTYGIKQLNREMLNPNAIEQFSEWFKLAVSADLAGEANLMTLCTVDEHSRPHTRIVLLKGYDAEGFVFYTNYESDKALQLEGMPYAALGFHWPELERQVRIEGAVEKTSREESEAYFYKRPRGSQLGAWASDQSQVIEGRKILEHKLASLQVQYEGKDIPYPEHWGGFRVKPDMIEFWQGRDNRLHDRFRYTMDPEWDAWLIERLSP